MQPTVPMIPMTRWKKNEGEESWALKKSQKVLAALVDAQIKTNKQHGVPMIKPTADPNEQFTYNALYP